MDSTFKPYRTGMSTVLEKYPCGKHSKGRNHVYYLCKCDCGKEFIVSGDELSKHPYSCGCTQKPSKNKGRTNESSLKYKNKTMLNMLKPTRAVYINSTSGVSGVSWSEKRKKWLAQIVFQQRNHFLGYFDLKEDAIKARIEGERKYFQPILELEEDK